MSQACDRARRYIRGVKAALESIPKEIETEYEQLINAVKTYLYDSDYYLNKKDCETALVAVSYAEGLLDSLKYLGVIEPKWPSRLDEKKVFVAGTFDIIHPGHIELLKFASRHGRLYVVIARDSNVEKNKGKKPLLSEKSRLKVISAIRYVYEARLGDPENIFRPIMEIKPDIIVLGPDQPFDPEDLKNILKEKINKDIIIIKYNNKKEFEPGMKGSSDIIRKACCQSYCASIGCT